MKKIFVALVLLASACASLTLPAVAMPQGSPKTSLPAKSSPAKTPASPEAPMADVDSARAILIEGIGSKDPTVRVEAIFAASMIGRTEAVLDRLEESLKDKNVSVRLATVQALGDLKSSQCLKARQRTLDFDKTREVAFAAARALNAMQDPAGIKALTDVYDHTRKTSSGIIKKQGRSFEGKFHSLPSSLTFIVSEGVGYVPLPGVGEGFSSMTTLLSEPELSDRATALLLITKTKNHETTDMLQKALQDSDSSVRATAAQVIAHTGRTTHLSQHSSHMLAPSLLSGVSFENYPLASNVHPVALEFNVMLTCFRFLMLSDAPRFQPALLQMRLFPTGTICIATEVFPPLDAGRPQG